MIENDLPGFGQIALMGSGETTQSGGQVFDALARQLPVPLAVGVLETPAGFELNSWQVAGRVGDFIRVRLQNYRPDVQVIPARKRGTAYSPDNPEIVAPLLKHDMIYMGAGSPSYAVRQLQGSLAWDYVQARHRLGAALAFASATSIAMGALALPVYEIYKVGEDPHWKPGLDLFAPFGLRLVIVSHWNNTEGGADLDTSRCFIGRARFDPLAAQLPPDVTLLGIDELTGVILDLKTETCQVMGKDSIHVIRGGREAIYSRGDSFSLCDLGDFRLPEDLSVGIRPEAWQAALDAREAARQPVQVEVPEQVLALVEQRQQARATRDWSGADRLRQNLADMGWKVTDTPEGPKIEPL